MGTPPDTVSVAHAAGRVWGRLDRVCDPEWLWFAAFALAPAVLCCGLGDLRRASFFLGAGLYAAALKWLGWALLGRRMTAPRPGLLAPLEMFAGLALACAWFYLRNAAAALVPAAYGLGELRVLAPLLAALHLAAAARSRPRLADLVRGLRSRLPVYGPFWGVLAVALWQMAGSLCPPTGDPIFHACAARAAFETGLFRPHPFLRTGWYPSGFAAVNAASMGLGPLDDVQAVNLQHVLWTVAALFLVAFAPALLVGRWFRLSGLWPLYFVAVVPLYALHPDVGYSGTPRQMAVALWAPVVLVPLLIPPRDRPSVAAAALVIGVLAALGAALNPACAPFAGLTLLAGLAVLTARRGAGRRLLPTLALEAVPVVLAAVLVVSCDPYYRPRLLSALRGPAPPPGGAPDEKPAEPPPAPASPAPAQRPMISFTAGLRAVSPLKLAALADNATLTGQDDEGKVVRWSESGPYPALPPVALLSAALLAGLALARRRVPGLPPGVARLTAFAVGGALVWVAVKAVVLFLIGAVSLPGPEGQLLPAYLGFLLFRWDFVLSFALLCAAGVGLYLLGQTLRPGWRLLLPLGTVVAGLAVAAGLAAGRWPPAGTVLLHPGTLHVVTPDDLVLVKWCDANVPPERGLIGMAAGIYHAGSHRSEKHVVGLGGACAFPLYGKGGNYCFTLDTLDPVNWYDGYNAHVRAALDAPWCRAQGIRYFYVAADARALNPGLVRAIEDGTLREVRRAGRGPTEAAVYEIAPAAETAGP